MVLPKPGVRDTLSLHHIENPSHDLRFVTIALPNRDHRQTEVIARQIFAVPVHHYGVLNCLAAPYFISANFTNQPVESKLSSGTVTAGPVSTLPHSIGVLRTMDGGRTWEPLK